MTRAAKPEVAKLPPTLRAERRGAVAVLTLRRAEKRNALNDPTVEGIEAFFSALPDGIGAVVLAGEGDHFSSGLDLSELSERDVPAGIAHSQSWHRASSASSSAPCRWSQCFMVRWWVADLN